VSVIERILLATNFDAPSDHARAAALRMADRLRATVTVLHVLDLPLSAYYAAKLPADFVSSLESVALSKLAETLAVVREKIPSANALLCHGVPWKQIVSRAESTGCQLIVLGSHSRGGGGRSLIGSVARDVARASSVPVLTVQDPDQLTRSLPTYS
jgi:nucleotide-binding universal stress UspA family protein